MLLSGAFAGLILEAFVFCMDFTHMACTDGIGFILILMRLKDAGLLTGWILQTSAWI